MLKWKAFTKLCCYYWTTVGQTALFIIRGDFDASIGSLLDGADDDLLGSRGVGQRSGRGRWLVQWILWNGLRVASRQKLLTRRRVALAEGGELDLQKVQ